MYCAVGRGQAHRELQEPAPEDAGTGASAAREQQPRDRDEGEGSDDQEGAAAGHRKSTGETQGKVVGYSKCALTRVEKVLSEFTDMPLSRDSVEKMMNSVNTRIQALQKFRGKLDKLEMREESQSLLIRMTTASRQMKLLHEVLLAFRAYYRDVSGGARDVLLGKLLSIETSFKSVIATVRFSMAMGLEACALEVGPCTLEVCPLAARARRGSR